MFIKSKIARSFSTFLMFVMGLSLFALAPLASAANPLITNVTIGLDPFHTNVPNYSAVNYIDYDYNTGGYPTGEVLEQIKNSDGDVVYEFGDIGTDDLATGHYQLVWDGTEKNGGPNDGRNVPDGDYTLYLYSLTATPPAAEFTMDFVVENTVIPEVELLSDPQAVYYTPSGDYELNYSLTQNSAELAATTIVRLTIDGPESLPQQDVTAELKALDGNYVIAWDGQMGGNDADPGVYTYTLNAEGSVDGFGVMSDDLSGEFTIVDDQNPSPSLSDLNASPDPYDPDAGLISLGYTLSGSLGHSTVNVDIYNSNDPGTSIKNQELLNQSNGSNSLSWDGKDDNSDVVPNGSYVFKVSGSDGNFSIVPGQVGFTIATVQPEPQPSAKCAGYNDVLASHPDCDAIEYVQSIGAMTGNPDGTFAPDELLQRDQVAKISLETYGLFNVGADYCAGNDPFPDVISSAWSYQYVCQGVDLGMITGYLGGADAGFYRPARSVNRVEFLALILRNLSDNMPSVNSSSYNDVVSGQWYSGYAKYSYDNSLFVGNNLSPTQFTTRMEVAEVLFKLHNLGKI